MVDDVNDGRDKVFPIDEPDVDDIIDSIKRNVCFKPTPSPTDAPTPEPTPTPTYRANCSEYELYDIVYDADQSCGVADNVCDITQDLIASMVEITLDVNVRLGYVEFDSMQIDKLKLVILINKEIIKQ